MGFLICLVVEVMLLIGLLAGIAIRACGGSGLWIAVGAVALPTVCFCCFSGIMALLDRRRSRMFDRWVEADKAQRNDRERARREAWECKEAHRLAREQQETMEVLEDMALQHSQGG